MTDTIQPLKKVTLSITPDDVQGKEPISLTFIFGLATGGLSSFEAALQDKPAGERVKLTVAGSEADAYFGHLLLPLRERLGLHLIPETISLQVEISGIEKPADIEVVKALAKSGAGCGGSCDCGCS